MSEERLNELFSIVNEGYSSIQEREIRDYITNLQQKVEQLENIRKEAYEFVEWHYKDNQKFYKNKGIGLNYPECDYLLNILNKFKGDNNEHYEKCKGSDE